MGFSFQGDPDLDPMAEFEKCPAGTYKCTGISRWISTDNEIPIYKFDKWRDGLIAQLELTRQDGGPNPAWSGTPLNVTLLARAFGGDIEKLPKDRNSTTFLVRAEEMIQKSKKTVTVDVNESGWVTRVHEATPPEGYYWLEVVSARSLDGSDPLTFQASNWGDDNRQLLVVFQIVGNMMGNPTPFDGFQIIYYMRDGFDGVVDDKPNLRLTAKGAESFAARRVRRFCEIFVPEIFEDEWAWQDSENPINEIMQRAIENNRMAVGHYTLNSPKRGKPRLVLDFDSLAPIETASEEEAPFDQVDLFTEDSSFETEHPHLAQFAEWIYNQEPQAFKILPIDTLKDVQLSNVGKEWATNNLVTVVTEAGLPPRPKALSSFTEEEALKLLNVVWSREGYK
jgi:hypothetical protein